MSVYIFPTLLKRGRKQVILSRKNNNGFELFINNEDKIQFNINFAQLNLITFAEAKFSIEFSLEESIEIKSARELVERINSHLK